MKKFYLLITIIFIGGVVIANNSMNNQRYSPNFSTSYFEPGDIVYIEIPGIDADKAHQIKVGLTADEIGAQWLGYCLTYEAICIKMPTVSQETLEDKLKQITGGYKMFTSSQVDYSHSNACFTID